MVDVIQIIPYSDQYQSFFASLNEKWITKHFKMEEVDRKSLYDPQGYILDKGGHIIVALHNNVPAGVCALIKMDHPEYDYELAKMAVTEESRGLGIGKQLGLAIIEKARTLGAKNVYLESNTVLKPAINLYRKLGFVEIPPTFTPYERCNIQMVVELT